MSNPIPGHTVFIVDDDEATRNRLAGLMRSVGLGCRAFASASEFLLEYDAGRPGCLLMETQLSGMSGLQLQEELHDRGIALPIVFLTAYGDVPTAVLAIQRGAADFIGKAADDRRIVAAVKKAIGGERADKLKHLRCAVNAGAAT